MDTYEATKTVMSRIQALDPENASRIMGYILIQDQSEKEMIRLAFGPESLLLSYVNQAKTYLGLHPQNSSSNSNSSSSSPSSNPNFVRPRILIPSNGFPSSNPSSPAFQRSSPRPFSYAAALNGSSGGANSVASSVPGSSSLHFYGGNSEFLGSQVQDQLQFLDDTVVDHHHPLMSPSGRSDSLVFPYGEDLNVSSPHQSHHPFHRRSCSVNDAAFLANLDDGGGVGGLGWRPCMYFARGFCKNGSSCKFLHTDGVEGVDVVGSPGNNGGGSGFDELLRLKALHQQQQRSAALMASGAHHPFAGYSNKCMDFMNESPRSAAAAALMMGDEFHKFNRCRPDKNELGLFSGLGSSSRQIYLTFPADSTFKEEDVSNYFSMFGPVQDVRIPYQQKRMFGFVTFVYPETVKLILAKGNPHFVCDSRVLVKPYKEKGKVAEKKQLLERGEFSSCLSPSAVDSREHFDLPFSSRMLQSTQEMMFRRKLEQEAELQHAIELQGRRMMNLKLMDLKSQHLNHNFMPSSPSGIPISSPRQAQFLMNHNFSTRSDFINQENSEFDNQESAKSPAVTASNENLVQETTESSANNNKQEHGNDNDSDLPESLEHILPDNLFASPTKLAAEQQSAFSQASAESDSISINVTNTSSNNTAVLPTSSPLTMASLNSCYFRMPRLSSGQEAIEM